MAYANWIPPRVGPGMPRMGMGYFNASPDLHRRQNGLKPKFYAAYTGFNALKDMTDNSYYGTHQYDLAGLFSWSGNGIIPVLGTSLATVDGAMTLDSLAAGANDVTIGQMLNNAYGGSNYTEIWWRLGYEANIQTTASGWRNGFTNWGPRWRAAFHHWATVARAYMAAHYPNRIMRICFDTTVINNLQTGPNGNTLALYKPEPVGVNPTGGYDIMSLDLYTGNTFPLTLASTPGFASLTPFTTSQPFGSVPSGATVDGFAVDYKAGAAPGGQGYTYDNMARFLTFQDAKQTELNGGSGQSLYTMINVARQDQVPIFHSEFGGISYAHKDQGGTTQGNGWRNISGVTVPKRLPDDVRPINDLNYLPYIKRCWATADDGVNGPPWLGAIIWDGSDGTSMSGPNDFSGNMHPGMRSTYQVLGYPLGQYGAIDPVIVINNIETAIAPGAPISVRIDTNFDTALSNFTIDFGFGNGPVPVSTIAGSAMVGTQSITVPFTPTVSGQFNITAHDNVRGYSSPPSDYTVSGSVVTPPPPTGGGSAYRQTWNVGAWFDFVIQQADGNPSLTILATVSSGSCQFDYYVSTGNTHPFDGVLTQGIAGGNLNIQGLTPNTKNNVRVYFGNNGNGAYSHLKITGAQLNAGSTPGQAPARLPRIKLYGDSISEAVFNHYTDSYWHLVAKSMRQYDFITQSSSGSGWLVVGEGGASLHAAWNKVDLTPDVTLLDSNGHISAYGATNSEPAGIFINHGSNEVLHPQFNDAQITAEVSTRLTAFRGAVVTATVISDIIPFGLYDTTSYPNGPVVVTDIKNGISSVATSANIKITDLGSAFSTQLRTGGFYVDGIHPNKAGHALIAQRLTPLVQAQMTNVAVPTGIRSIAMETIGVNNQVVAGQAYSFVGHADVPWASVDDVMATTQETSTGKVFTQANTINNSLGGQHVTLSADGLVATVSNIASGLLTPHTGAMKDKKSGTESNNIPYMVVRTAPPPLVIGSISVTTSTSSFINAPYVAVGVADNPWLTPDNVFVSIQATGSAKQYVKANTVAGVTVALSVDKKTVTVSGLVSGVAGPHTLFMRDSASNTESAGFAYTIAPIVVVPTITVIALQPIGIKRQDGLGQVNSTEPFDILGIADQPFTDVNNVLLSITPTGVAPVFTTPPSVTLSTDRKTATITGVTSSLVTTAVAFLKDAASGTVSLGVNFVIAPAGTPPPVIIPPSTIIDQIVLQPVGINGKVITGSAYSVVAVADAPWKSVNDVLISATQGGTAQNFNIANGFGNQSVTLSDDGFTAIISNIVSNIPGDDSVPFVIYIKDAITGTVSAPTTILLVPVGTVITTGISKIIIDPIGTNNDVEENTFLTIIGHADSPFLSPDDVLVSTEVLVPTKFYVNANAAGYTVTLSDNGLTATVSQIPAGQVSPHIGYMEDAKSTIESNGEIYEVVPTAVVAPGMSRIALGPIGNTSANVLDTDVYSIFGVADAPWSDASNVLISIQLVSSGLTSYVSAEDAGYTVTLSSNNTVATVAGIITLIDGDYVALMQDSGTHIISNQVNFHVIHAPVVQQSLITVQSFGNPVTATPFTVVGVADQPWTNAASVQISLALTPTQSFVAASTIGTVILSNDGKIATIGNITAGAAGNYTAYLKDLGSGVVSAGLPFTITPTVVTNPSMTHITMQPIGTNGSVVADTVYSMSAVADGPWSTNLALIQLSMQLSTAGQVWVGAQGAGLTVAVNTTTRTATISGIVSHVQGTYTGYIRDTGTGIAATSGMQFVVGPAAAVPLTQIVVPHINDLATGQAFTVSGVADHPWSSVNNVLVSIGATQSFVTAATTPGLSVALSQDKLTATVSGLTAPAAAGTYTAYLRDSAAGITSAGVQYVVATTSPPLSVMTQITVQSVGSPTAVTSGQPYTAVSRANGPWSSAAAVQISTQLQTGSPSWVDPRTNGTNVVVTISADHLTCTITGLLAGIQQPHVFYIRDTGSGPSPGVTSPGFTYQVGGAPVETAAWSEPPAVPVPAHVVPGTTIRLLGTYCNDRGVSWNPDSSQTSSSGFRDVQSWKHGRDNFADLVGVAHGVLNAGNLFTGTQGTHKAGAIGDLVNKMNLVNQVYTNPPYDYIPSIGVKLFCVNDISPATGRAYVWNDGQAYIDVMNGLWDSYFTSVVDTMVNKGRPIFIFRPGYENNQAFMQDFSGYDNQSGQLANWRKAMRHVCLLIRNRSAQMGAYALSSFNPSNATQNNPNVDVSFAAIGADVQNLIQIDIYNGYWILPASQTGSDTSGRVSGVGPSLANRIAAWSGTAGGWNWNQCSALSIKYGVPIYLTEGGCSGGDHHMLNDPDFYPWLATAINAHIAAGGQYIGFNIWSVQASDGSTNIQDGAQPATAASLAGVINTIRGQAFDPANLKFGGTHRIGAP